MCELIAKFSATMVTSPWRERREVWREKRKVRIFGKGKCKLIANCANFWQVKVCSSPILARQCDVTSVFLSLSLCISLSLSLSLSHRKYLTHNIGSASALPIKCDVTSVFLSLSLCISLSLSLSLSLSHRKYLTHNIGSASALPIIRWRSMVRCTFSRVRIFAGTPATHGSAKFVHRCLALTTPVLNSLLCCFDERLNAAFFFFALITVDCFWETQSTKSRKVSWRVFSKRQSGPAGSRIPDRPNLNFDRSRMVLRQECFGNYYLSEFRKQTGRQWEKPKKANIDARAREKKPADMVTFPVTLDAESPWGWLGGSGIKKNFFYFHYRLGWPKTTLWPWCKRYDEILRCRIVRFWYSVTGRHILESGCAERCANDAFGDIARRAAVTRYRDACTGRKSISGGDEGLGSRLNPGSRPAQPDQLSSGFVSIETSCVIHDQIECSLLHSCQTFELLFCCFAMLAEWISLCLTVTCEVALDYLACEGGSGIDICLLSLALELCTY